MRASQTAQHTIYRRIAAIGAACCVLLVAGCGSSDGSSPSRVSRTYAQGVKYADCMRSHGVPTFPDPNSQRSSAAPQTTPADELAPAYKSAQSACAKLRPGAKALPGAISSTQKASMIANARCIRRHGVPDFPDPRFGPSGGVEIAALGKEASSPAFVRAVKTCDHIGIPLPGPS